MRHNIKSYLTVVILVLVFVENSNEGRAQLSFSDVTAARGLGDYRATAGDLHSPGGVFTDLNNDGYADLYLIRSDGDDGKYNQLYLNVSDGGAGRTFGLQANALGAQNELSGGTLTNDTGATGAIAADYDNDGDIDLYVTNMNGTNRLYQNQLANTGTLSFTDVTGTAGVAGLSGSSDSLSAAWADPDRDGDLDLYVGSHSKRGELRDGERDTFYRNNGDGTFTDVTGMAGPLPGSTLGPTGFENSTGGDSTANQTYSDTNAVIFADFNNDQWPDLLVTNKTTFAGDADMLYINQGNDVNGDWQGYKTVTYDIPTLASNISQSAMGVNVGDVDNDGDLDIYIADNPGFGATGVSDLLINQFSETGTLDFVKRDVNAGLSWGVQIEDFDNDGNAGIHVTNDPPSGFTPSGESLFQFADPSNPLTSTINDVATSAGILNADSNGRGSLVADYNRDGKLDLFVVNLNNDPRFAFTDDPSVLFENTTTGGGGFLSLKLIGDPTNPNGNLVSTRDAIGARVKVIADIDGDGSLEELIREVVSGSSNAASTSSLALEFGLGQATTVDVEIWWPDGRTMSMQNVAANQFLTINAIPEPSSLLLTMMGLVMGSLVRYGRQQK